MRMLLLKMFKLLLFSLLVKAFANGSVELTRGSFDEQTYGKNGVVLLYNEERESIYEEWKSATGEVEDEDIYFWELSCTLASEFCRSNANGKELPVVLYSFRNEGWQSLSVKGYSSHALSVFFNTEIKSNCFKNRRLCTEIMTDTLEKFESESFSVVRTEYLTVQQEAAQIEHDWDEKSREIQAIFFKEKGEIQKSIDVLDQRMKVLGEMLENMHHIIYNSNVG